MRIGGNELSVLPWLPHKEIAQKMKEKFEKQQKMARGASMFGGRAGPGLGINMLRDPGLLGRGRMARPM